MQNIVRNRLTGEKLEWLLSLSQGDCVICFYPNMRKQEVLIQKIEPSDQCESGYRVEVSSLPEVWLDSFWINPKPAYTEPIP